MADNIKTARAIKENGRESLRKVSISRIKKEMNDVFYPVSYTHLTLPTTPYV